jgi:ADP-glucose pyrophosphorylase
MPEIRQDLTTREWVIIATERAKRPHEFASLPHRSGQASRSSCVFCPGNEKLVREGARWYQYSRQLLLLSSKVRGTQVQRAIIADGCIITDAHIKRSVIGIRSVIESGTTIRNSVLMGAGFYQAEAWEPKLDAPPLSIGRHCHIEGAIIDKNARIAEGVVITPNGKPANMDVENYCIRDGVVVVTKGAVIPNGTSI